jgi:hypothetical protein
MGPGVRRDDDGRFAGTTIRGASALGAWEHAV